MVAGDLCVWRPLKRLMREQTTFPQYKKRMNSVRRRYLFFFCQTTLCLLHARTQSFFLLDFCLTYSDFAALDRHLRARMEATEDARKHGPIAELPGDTLTSLFGQGGLSSLPLCRLTHPTHRSLRPGLHCRTAQGPGGTLFVPHLCMTKLSVCRSTSTLQRITHFAASIRNSRISCRTQRYSSAHFFAAPSSVSTQVQWEASRLKVQRGWW